MLHRLHPLAGQGFNMSLRDIKQMIIILKHYKNNCKGLFKSKFIHNKHLNHYEREVVKFEKKNSGGGASE